MILQYIGKEQLNHIAYEQIQACSTRKWVKFEHKILFVNELELDSDIKKTFINKFEFLMLSSAQLELYMRKNTVTNIYGAFGYSPEMLKVQMVVASNLI